jgi:hypothetical protein
MIARSTRGDTRTRGSSTRPGSPRPAPTGTWATSTRRWQTGTGSNSKDNSRKTLRGSTLTSSVQRRGRSFRYRLARIVARTRPIRLRRAVPDRSPKPGVASSSPVAPAGSPLERWTSGRRRVSCRARTSHRIRFELSLGTGPAPDATGCGGHRSLCGDLVPGADPRGALMRSESTDRQAVLLGG